MEVGRVRVPELREGSQPEKDRFCSVAALTTSKAKGLSTFLWIQIGQVAIFEPMRKDMLHSRR